MATGKKSFKKSVKDSDVFYDYPCNPCEKDGKNVEATKYCVDCEENLCGSCLSLHKKFAVTRGHNVSDKIQTIRGHSKTLPSQRCLKHAGKTIDVYCPKHDEVGCSTCIAVNHSMCDGKQFIPDVASGIKTSKEMKQLDIEMKQLQKRLESLEIRKRGNTQELHQNKEALLKEIKLVRKRMNDQLDLMEKTLVGETENMFKEKIDAINNTIKEIETSLETLKQTTENLKSQQPDVDIFVACKMIKQKMSTEYHPMLERLDQRLHEVHFDLQIDEDLRLIMEGKRVFATIKESLSIKEATHEMDIMIKVDEDEELCLVTDICSLSDGCLVLTDVLNEALKKYDPVTGNVSTLIGVPCVPSGVCLVDNTRLAVSLINMKKVQFVSIAGRIALTNSFSVGDRCKCLAHCDGLLYVCCGGSQMAEHKEGKGHVEVYNCKGELLRCFYEDMVCPEYISVVKDGTRFSIVTSDNYKGVMIRGPDGAVRHSLDTSINTIMPFCMIDTDTLCIGEHDKKRIYIQTVSDKQILIEPRNLKGKPLCLYYDKPSSRLYVSVRVSDTGDYFIQVFKLM